MTGFANPARSGWDDRFPVYDTIYHQSLWLVVARRKKLLLIATLAYAFLLSLLDPQFDTLRTWLIRTFCHRTGKRSRDTPAPLYRLRLAISLFWFSHPPSLLSFL